MSRYIVDTSILIQRFISEEQTPLVREMFRNAPDDEFIIPEFCLVECTNVLWKHVRFQGMPQKDAEVLAKNISVLPVTLYDVKDLMEPALKVGLTHELAIYDSIYIAMAGKLQLPLITVDVKQARVARLEGVTIKPITDFAPPDDN